MATRAPARLLFACTRLQVQVYSRSGSTTYSIPKVRVPLHYVVATIWGRRYTNMCWGRLAKARCRSPPAPLYKVPLAMAKQSKTATVAVPQHVKALRTAPAANNPALQRVANGAGPAPTTPAQAQATPSTNGAPAPTVAPAVPVAHSIRQPAGKRAPRIYSAVAVSNATPKRVACLKALAAGGHTAPATYMPVATWLTLACKPGPAITTFLCAPRVAWVTQVRQGGKLVGYALTSAGAQVLAANGTANNS
jgi:hypothetical protein